MKPPLSAAFVLVVAVGSTNFDHEIGHRYQGSPLPYHCMAFSGGTRNLDPGKNCELNHVFFPLSLVEEGTA